MAFFKRKSDMRTSTSRQTSSCQSRPQVRKPSHKNGSEPVCCCVVTAFGLILKGPHTTHASTGRRSPYILEASLDPACINAHNDLHPPGMPGSGVQPAALPKGTAGRGGVRTVHGGVLWPKGAMFFPVRKRCWLSLFTCMGDVGA